MQTKYLNYLHITYTKITHTKCKKVVWTLKKVKNKIWILLIKQGSKCIGYEEKLYAVG